jgi:hypothetical protein
MNTKPVETVFVNLGEFLIKRAIERIEAEPLTVTVHLTDGTIEMPIGPKHPWFKELNRRRTEQINVLRAKLSQNPNAKKESDVLVDRATPDSVSQNENTNSRAAN